MSFFKKLLGQQNTYIGIDIGTGTIKMIEVEAGKDGFRLINIAMSETPADVIDGSIISEPQTISEALSQMISRQGFNRVPAVSSLAGQALITRLIELPRMAENELGEAMKWEVERYIPFPAQEVVLDFKALPCEDPEATQMEVLLAAARKEMVNNHIAAISGAKLDLGAIDIEPLALARALVTTHGLEDGSAGNVLIVNIGETMTDITIVKGDNLGFNRSIPTGGKNITQAISGFLLVGLDEAEQVKLTKTVIKWQDVLPPLAENAEVPSDPVQTGNHNDYDRILDFELAASSDKAQAGEADDAGASEADTADDKPITSTLDLGSFFSQPLEATPEAATQPADQSATEDADGPAEDYQGISLEALYGIDPLPNEEKAQPADPLEDISAVNTPPPPALELSQDAPDTVASEDGGQLSEAGQVSPDSLDTAVEADEDDGRLLEVVAPVLQEILNELRRSIDYFRTRVKGSGSIDRIILSGGTANLRNIDNYIEMEMGIPVEIADPFKSIDTSAFDESYIREIAPAFSIAVGLALRELTDV